MAKDAPLLRQEHLQQLEPFCRGLTSSLAQSGLSAEEAAAAWRVGVSAECVQCGIRLFGEELYALSQPPSPTYASPKIGRLRLGDCAREGCNSYYYRLMFYPQPKVDWPKILGSIKTEENPPAEERPHIPKSLLLQARALGLLKRRVWLALGIIVLLLVARQVYRGGSIPLVREPENFRIGTDPQHERSQRGSYPR